MVTIDASLREAIEFSIELRGIRVSFAWLPEVERANRSVPGNSWKMVHPHTPASSSGVDVYCQRAVCVVMRADFSAEGSLEEASGVKGERKKGNTRR